MRSKGLNQYITRASALHVASETLEMKGTKFSFLCISGHLVSSYVKHHLPLILVRELSRSTNLEKVLTDSFFEVDRNMVEGVVDCEFSGTTAVVGLLKVEHAKHTFL